MRIPSIKWLGVCSPKFIVIIHGDVNSKRYFLAQTVFYIDLYVPLFSIEPNPFSLWRDKCLFHHQTA